MAIFERRACFFGITRCLTASQASARDVGLRTRRPLLRPCNFHFRDSDRLDVAVAGGSPIRPGSLKTVGERGAPPVSPLSPNSRRGRKARSPIRQGRVAMESITVIGIDVSKDRLDVAVRPSGEAFAVERNGAGLEQLTIRLRELAPQVIALEATGGFET